jgi:iron complex outermembrane recepter protein
MVDTPRKKLSLLIHACIVSSFTFPLGAYAQQNGDDQVVEELIVTGSRVRRDGYDAPTPLTVVTGDTLRDSGDTSIVAYLLTLPAVAGAWSSSAKSGVIGQGMAGLETLSLRSLGESRTLVLLDGERMTASHYEGYSDVGAIPSNLISRIDIVTGGASAVYGSDAVAGVVNFVLDKDYTGFETEVSSGFTSYGDDKNEKVTLTAGFPFANGRGHVLLSGTTYGSDGIDKDGGRNWNNTGWIKSPTPGHKPTNGLPQLRFAPNTALSTATAGGLIVGGPLKGTDFGAGGTPGNFIYGDVAGSFMTGGDWEKNNLRLLNDMKPAQSSQNTFTRVSYDLTDNFNVFGQFRWSSNKVDSFSFPMVLAGTSSRFTIQRDNAFLPASTGAAMDANNITSFPIGSWNDDMGRVDNICRRVTSEATLGAEGTFELADTEWEWRARYTVGETDLTVRNRAVSLDRYRQTIDAVTDPATGQVVCRSVLEGANNGCTPWNPMGVGVNDGNAPAHKWMIGNDGFAEQDGILELETFTAGVTGDPFSTWAGPVSVALSVENRRTSSDVQTDNLSFPSTRPLGNLTPLVGELSVKEAAIELIVPLAIDQSWARSLDLSLALRGTDYERSGRVTTWKVGSTYQMNDSIKLRFTKSKDIRAPNLFELFVPGQAGCGSAVIFDPFRGQQAPQGTCSITTGNVNLKPEIADTTGIGFVLTPSFLPALSLSVDYWEIDMTDAIQGISTQQVVDVCFLENTALGSCGAITRDDGGLITNITRFPINLAEKIVEGVDVEASYSLSENFSLHANATFYLKNFSESIFNPRTDSVGEVSGFGVPDVKANVSANYASGPYSGSLTARYVSDGVISNKYIECTAGCPAPTSEHPTINKNGIPSRTYLDGSLKYEFGIGDSEGEVFVAVRNMLDRDPPNMDSSYFYYMGLFSSNYDFFGRTFRVGVRFKI